MEHEITTEDVAGVLKVDNIARIVHEANRAYCETVGDFSQVPYDDAPLWQRESACAGVRGIMDGTIKSPEDSHASWLAQKVADGWVYGAEKDPVLKTHPCMVPYSELPAEQKRKDHLFRAIVLALTQPV